MNKENNITVSDLNGNRFNLELEGDSLRITELNTEQTSYLLPDIEEVIVEDVTFSVKTTKKTYTFNLELSVREKIEYSKLYKSSQKPYIRALVVSYASKIAKTTCSRLIVT